MLIIYLFFKTFICILIFKPAIFVQEKYFIAEVVNSK